MVSQTSANIAQELKQRMGHHLPVAQIAPTVMVTPYLPKDAIAQIKSMPSLTPFVLALEVMPGTCPNCGGGGRVYLRFAKSGPWKYPPGGKDVIFWFDGSELNGKGWYIQHELRVYPCPECTKKGKL